jgi:hypothetical protein
MRRGEGFNIISCCCEAIEEDIDGSARVDIDESLCFNLVVWE